MLNIYNNADALLERLKNRIDSKFDEALQTAREIIADVRANGDSAVKRYTSKFDGVELDNLFMTDGEINQIFALCDKELIKIMEKAAQNIEDYHKIQVQNSSIITHDGIILGQRVLPLERVALYVPGGTAAYPSSFLMSAIPAKVAGVRELIVFTPPKKGGIKPEIIAAAKISGVNKIVKVGGAQAVAAAAYGTESIARVDKIVGPGNIYVAAAKKLVYGDVDIDSIAGPSEILIIADKNANPKFIAADLMSQAEHDIIASSVLLTDSPELAEQVNAELKAQVKNLSRSEIIRQSLADYGGCVLCESIAQAVELSNQIAPEHLQLMVANPFELLDSVKNAGSVFLGEYSPEPLGDYFAGTNHILPTNGTARFASPLGVYSFVKKSSFIYYSREKLREVSSDIIKFAESEELTAHANSVRVRENEMDNYMEIIYVLVDYFNKVNSVECTYSNEKTYSGVKYRALRKEGVHKNYATFSLDEDGSFRLGIQAGQENNDKINEILENSTLSLKKNSIPRGSGQKNWYDIRIRKENLLTDKDVIFKLFKIIYER